MPSFNCPYCGCGTMVLQTIARHETRVAGIPTVVPDAELFRCSSCQRTTVSSKELRRWRAIQRAELRGTQSVPTPAQVRALREDLCLSVADFAALLGVTRQAAHAWERDDSSGMSLGPTALLIQCLREERGGGLRSILEFLLTAAVARGRALMLGDAPVERTVSHDRKTSAHKSAIRARPPGAPTFVRAGEAA